MKIVVQDANIIIDAINMGITHYFKEMGVEFHTTDLVNNEIRGDEQRLKLDKLIANGVLKNSYPSPIWSIMTFCKGIVV